MTGNILEMSREECIKNIEDVAANMNGYGDHNTRYDINRSLMDFVLDGEKHTDSSVADKLDASVAEFLRGAN